MKDSELETFLKEMKKETLSQEEKASLWHSISTVIKTRSPLPAVIPIHYFMIKKRLIPVLFSIAILVGVGGGTVALANNAAPGDFLYPVDRAVENARLSLAQKEQKDALRIAFSVERVEEAEHILSVNNVSLAAVTATTTTATSTLSNKSLEAAKKGLEIALAYIEASKQEFQAEGNTNAVATLDIVASRLSEITTNHLATLEKISVKINDNGGVAKAQIQAISNSIKTNFKIEEKKNGDIKIEFSSTSKKDPSDNSNNNSGKNKDKDKKDNDHDDDRDDRDDDKKITICHNRTNTITVSKNALWAHIKHGDTKGQCVPTQHNNAPVFTGFDVDTDKTSAKIIWRTNENTTGTLWYGTSTPIIFGTSTLHVDDARNTKSHELTLSSLSPDTTYYLVIVVKDEDGATATSSQKTFRTDKEPGDETAPIISDVSVNDGVATATIRWETNENGTGVVYVGTSSPLTIASSLKNESSLTLAQAHTVSFTGLLENTTYRFFIVARDAAGNTATSSTVSFTTDIAPDTDAPAISSLVTSDIASTSAKVTFATNENATSKLWLSTNSPVSTSGVADYSIGSATNSHTFNLSGLTASTTYHYLVTAKDTAGNTATSSERTFTTPD